jgi:hypothetical protein
LPGRSRVNLDAQFHIKPDPFLKRPVGPVARSTHLNSSVASIKLKRR